MKTNKVYFSVFLLIVYVISLLTFGVQPAKAEIAAGITVPSFSQLQPNAKYPDPFKMLDGKRMTTKAQWERRRQEISALAQTHEYGIIPGKPQSVTGSMSGSSIVVTCTQNGKTISFSCKIDYPSTGKAPYPAIIGCGANTLSTAEILKLGVACITFPCDELGQQSGMSTRGKGKFYDLYGSTHSCGALGAWSWGTSRLIDALETTPAAKIDATKLGVTGGSRYGKGALAMGAFDERVVLTIPQESGSGGSGNYRFAEAIGSTVQRISSTVSEQPWFSKSLDQFSNSVNKLPYDHHEILALCAPRALLLIENPDFTWLCNEGCWNNGKCVQMVYQALGVADRMGYSSVGSHGHCQLPASQYPDVNAFIKRFLLGDKTANTNIFKNDRNYTLNTSKWIDWDVPTLADPLTYDPLNGSTTSPSPSVSISPTNTPVKPSPSPSQIVVTEDINGDGVVNIADVMLIANAFNSLIGNSRYNEKCDLDKNGAVNIADAMIVAAKFNKVVS